MGFLQSDSARHVLRERVSIFHDIAAAFACMVANPATEALEVGPVGHVWHEPPSDQPFLRAETMLWYQVPAQPHARAACGRPDRVELGYHQNRLTAVRFYFHDLSKGALEARVHRVAGKNFIRQSAFHEYWEVGELHWSVGSGEAGSWLSVSRW